jgi:hypothetical protein
MPNLLGIGDLLHPIIGILGTRKEIDVEGILEIIPLHLSLLGITQPGRLSLRMLVLILLNRRHVRNLEGLGTSLSLLLCRIPLMVEPALLYLDMMLVWILANLETTRWLHRRLVISTLGPARLPCQ